MPEVRLCQGCRAELSPESPGEYCERCAPEVRPGEGRNIGTTADQATGPYRGTPAAPAPAELNQLIPHVEVLGLLGQGGMGAVYKARQTRLDRLVALKILPPQADPAPTFAARFTREARALARLNHPHIVAVHDFGEGEGLYYLLMEYVEGGNLRQLLRSGPLPAPEALRIAVQVCDALQYAHEEGIIHRDIKPENILLDRRGRVKLADFGLARMLEGATADFRLTASRQVMGTFHYMAPEQFERPLEVDHRADIYALGVVLYEMLTGGLPLGHFALPSEKAAVDDRLDRVVLRALKKEPDHRYQQVRALREDLEAVMAIPRPEPVSGGPTEVYRPATERGDEPTAVGVEPPRRPDEVTVRAARRQLQGPVLALQVVGCLGCLGWLFLCLAVVADFANQRFWPSIKDNKTLSQVVFLSAVVGLVLIGGALRIKALRSYRFGVACCLLAMLPLSLAWPVNLPVGLWAFRVLRRREVRAAFPGGLPAPGATAARARHFFRTTGIWAILCCGVGLFSCLLPWNRGYGRPSLNGFSTWYGILDLTTFLALLATLVATKDLEPTPVWRPVAMLAAGLGVVLWTGLYLRYESVELGPFNTLEGVAYIPFGCGLGLVLLGTRQLRRLLTKPGAGPDNSGRPPA